MTVIIRDLSVYDPTPIDYSAYSGFVIRCFNGNYKDAKFDLHKAGAVIAEKPWWAYAFYNFNYPALPQVNAVINILRDEPGVMPPFFDVEEWSGYHYPSREILLSNLKALHDTWYAYDADHCGFYMNPATIHYLKPIPEWLWNCPLWIAHWGVPQPDFEPWRNYTFWQYSGEPDLNRFNGTDDQYWALVGGSPPPQPPALPSIVRVTASSV